MEGIEDYIVKVVSELTKMQVPITCRQGLELTNSLISGTTMADKLKAWKTKYCVMFTKNGGNGALGPGYWHGLMKRHGHKVKARKGIKFDNK